MSSEASPQPSRESSPPRSVLRVVVRWGLYQLYSRLAFAYDLVSVLVSRGEWRTWTRAAIPFIRGTRILEIAHGTGNLHLDLYSAGYEPIGVDLSANMGALTQEKFRSLSTTIAGFESPSGERSSEPSQKHLLPRLVRAPVQKLPFPDESFSSLVMTFPPAFVNDLDAMREMWRVLEANGMLLWVDAPQIYPRDGWSRFLNWLFQTTGGCANPETDEIANLLREAHDGALEKMWTWRVERVESKQSAVHVFIGTKHENSH